MRYVGQEAALGVEQALEALEGVVEGLGQPADFIIGQTFERDAARKVVGDRPVARVERLHRLQSLPGLEVQVTRRAA